MQRPILILVLVLAAIGALLFGVFQLLSDGGTPEGTTRTAVNPPAETRTNTSVTPLEADANKGTGTRVNTPIEDRDPGDDAASFQYDNQLVGLVVNKEGAPVPDAELTLTPVGTQELFFVNDPVDHSKDIIRRTDKDGKFSFRNIEPRNKYQMIVKHPEYTRKELTTVPVGPQGASTEPTIVLSHGAQLAGHIRDEGGNAVPGAVLHLDGNQYQTSPYEPPDRISVTTNGEGYYTFRNIPAGNRVMLVQAQGYGTITVNGLMFRLDEPMTRDVTLKVAEMICGRVVGPGNQGIPNASVLAIGFNMSQQTARGQATTDDKGDFCLENLMPGRYNVIASCKGWRFDKALPANSNTQNVVLEGHREADACGRVVDADSGAPLPGFKVRLRIAYPGNPQTQPIPDSDTLVEGAANGEFCIAGVQASGDGGYVVEAQANGYAPGFSSIFSVAPGQTVNGIEVRLGHGGTLRGRLVDGDGKPVSRALVQTHDNEWTQDAFTEALGAEYPTQTTSASTRTNAQGFFTIKNLNPDIYQITIEAAGYSAYEQKDISVTAGAENNIGDVRLPRGGTIQGRLFDPSGKPVAGGRVELQILEGDRPRSYRAKTGTDGAYTITSIVPGRYKLFGSAIGDGTGNPFDDLRYQKESERQISVSEGDTQRGVDVNLAQ